MPEEASPTGGRPGLVGKRVNIRDRPTGANKRGPFTVIDQEMVASAHHLPGILLLIQSDAGAVAPTFIEVGGDKMVEVIA